MKKKPAKAAAGLPPREGWTTTLGRVLVHAITGAVIAFPLSVLDGIVAATLGCGLGALLARFVARSRGRLLALTVASAFGLAAVIALREMVVGASSVASALGPASALRIGDAVIFGLGGFAVSLGLRTLSTRRPALAVLEVGLVAGGFATLLIAHRHGAIHRPFEIADPILSRGEDPALAVLVIGALGAAVIGLLLLSERSIARSAFHLGVVVALLLVILGTTQMMGLPPPPASGNGLGLRDDDPARREREGGGSGGSSGRRQNDELEFRDEYQSSSADVPVGVVLLHEDYSPPSGVYYFRQNAFSQYNGRRLISATRPGVDLDVQNAFPTSAAIEVPSAPSAGMDRAPVETTVALLAEHARPFGLEAPARFEPAENPNPSRFRRAYRVYSASTSVDEGALLGRPAFDPAWPDDVRSHYSYAPSDPRYRRLAERMVARLPDHLRSDPVAQALAITSYLGHRGTYSLRSRHAGAEDPTAHFLFGDLTGYCVHFAHAAVYLMRSIGLPARVATGYAISEAARQGGSAILVRDADSHAWPELYVAGAGWIVTDVTPERVLDPPPPPPDPQLQRLLGEMARGESPLTPEGTTPPRPLAEVLREARSPVLYSLAGLLAALVLLGYAIKLWRRAAPRMAGARARPRVVYRAALDLLAEAWLSREVGESREAFARRLAAEVPSLGPLTDGHLASAFGGGHARRRAPVGDAYRDVRRELSRAVPLWRRALG